jgi:hypothetical protein
MRSKVLAFKFKLKSTAGISANDHDMRHVSDLVALRGILFDTIG